MMLIGATPIMAESVDLFIDGYKVQSSLDVAADECPDIEVPAQLVKGVTLVPLRFIAEAFGTNVNYVDGKVTVDTPAVVYDGVKIKSLQCYVAMTMGGYLNETQSNKTIETTLADFNLSSTNEVSKPKEYTDYLGYAMDVSCCYITSSYYAGFDIDGNEVFKYEIYQLINSHEGTDMPGWLLRDVKADKWYKYTNRPQGDIGFWKQVYNNAA